MSSNSVSQAFAALALLIPMGVFSGCQSSNAPGPNTSAAGGSGQKSTPTPSPTPIPTATPTPAPGAPTNVMTVTVNGSLCGNKQYSNQICASATICSPGTSNCQTINNLLLDTGSYGLRIFQSIVTVPLNPVASGNGTLTECVQYADGSSEWGPVHLADVRLANEPAVQVPIQLINSTYGTPPRSCSTAEGDPDVSPDQTGFNGILGVGLFAHDCGPLCASTANNGIYYKCVGATCTAITASLTNQVQNPVTLLPVNNNGVILSLPAVPPGGTSFATGTLTLGIGTQLNNIPTGVTRYATDANGEFRTEFPAFRTNAMLSFIDSGSNVLFIPPPTNGTLPDCNSTAGGSRGSAYAGFFCPSATQSLTATNKSYATNPTTSVINFDVANTYSLFNSGANPANAVFSNIAASSGSTPVFDWGLPFFFGRSVYVGFESTTSPLGSGPYWAY